LETKGKEKMNLECKITRWKIEAMFEHFTPEKVGKTREEINEHLLTSCREFFEKKAEEKIKEKSKCHLF